MSAKRARYDGPSGTGVEIDVELSDGQTIRSVHVGRGQQLPAELNGVKVAPEFLDGLLEQEDWSGSAAAPKRGAAKSKASPAAPTPPQEPAAPVNDTAADSGKEE